MHIFVHPHVCISFLCRSDARAKAPNVPSTQHPNFIGMRWAFGTKISLGLCSYFLVCTRSLLAQVIRTQPWLSRTPHNFLFFWVEPLVGASAGPTPPLYGIIRGLLGWNSRLYGGYEVDIYLF